MTILNGTLIRNLREQKGWRQRDLAHTASIDASVISRLERGLQHDTQLSIALSLASALDVTLDALINVKRDPAGTLIPELEAVISRLREQPSPVQIAAAGMLQGYLSARQRINQP